MIPSESESITNSSATDGAAAATAANAVSARAHSIAAFTSLIVMDTYLTRESVILKLDNDFLIFRLGTATFIPTADRTTHEQCGGRGKARNGDFKHGKNLRL